MKMTWPPPQVIFVGFESNQHGQAASQEQASSNWPETFQGAFFSSARAASMPARRRSSARTVFLRIFSPPFFAAESIPRCATPRARLLLDPSRGHLWRRKRNLRERQSWQKRENPRKSRPRIERGRRARSVPARLPAGAQARGIRNG